MARPGLMQRRHGDLFGVGRDAVLGTDAVGSTIDAAGNTMAGTGHSYTLDSGAGGDATVTAISVDSGTAGDFITSGVADGERDFTGTLGAGETIQVSADGGTTWVTPRRAGRNLYGRRRDAVRRARTLSVRTSTRPATRRPAPATATRWTRRRRRRVATVTALSADTGTAGDFITNTASQTVSGTYSGTLGAGEKIQVSANGGTTWVDATADQGRRGRRPG